MKKLIITTVLALTVLGGAFANNNETLKFKGSDKFSSAYPMASNVKYKVTKDYTQVSFVVNGDVMTSFYSGDGNLIATSFHIALRKLPEAALETIKDKYTPAGYRITEAIEMDHEDNGLNYYVTLTGKDKKVVLEISTEGNVSIFKSIKN
ncbi:hypothetical protein ACI6Q2_10475 [Chitinophagaceae bacterium LWZ2-11]